MQHLQALPSSKAEFVTYRPVSPCVCHKGYCHSDRLDASHSAGVSERARARVCVNVSFCGGGSFMLSYVPGRQRERGRKTDFITAQF